MLRRLPPIWSTLGYLCLYAGLGVLASNTVDAAEWLVNPTLRASSEYVDNPRLLVAGGETLVGAVGEVSSVMQRVTERSQLVLSPRLAATRYQEDNLLDNDVRSLAAQYDRRWERMRWTGAASYTRDTTLTSELGLSGFVQANREHEGIAFNLSPSATLTERTNAGLRLGYSNNHYIDAKSTGLVDYDYRTASLFGNFDYSEQTRLTITARGGELHVPDAPLADKQDAAVQFGWSYQAYSLWNFAASAGPSYLKSKFGSDTGSVFQLSAQRTAEHWSVSASASRDLTPTGQGVLTRSDQLTLELNRFFTERLSAGISLSGIRNQDQLAQPNAEAPTLEYLRGELSINWQFAEHWSLAFLASGATQKYNNAPDAADSYRTSIGIVWNGQPRSL